MAEAAERWGGSWNGTVWTICFDESWQQTEDEVCFRLQASPQNSGIPYLGAADLNVFWNETMLVEIEAAWQEVASDD